MNLNTGYFPSHTYRRKQPNTSYHISLTNQQQHHHGSSLHSARSSLESTNGNESFLPSISTATVNNDSHRPYRRNDFANNHLFLAKRKLAGLLLGQSTRNLQATSDLIHLFDQQEPRSRKQTSHKHNLNKTLPDEHDAHLSVVDLVIKPPYPSFQIRDPLAAMSRNRRRSQIYPPKVPRSSIDTIKQNFQSTSFHTFTDNNESNDLVDSDNLSDALSTCINPLDSSILCVKSIIPSAGPQHTNHHLLQHR